MKLMKMSRQIPGRFLGVLGNLGDPPISIAFSLKSMHTVGMVELWDEAWSATSHDTVRGSKQTTILLRRKAYLSISIPSIG